MATHSPLKLARIERHAQRIRGAGVKNMTADFNFCFDAFTKVKPRAAAVSTELTLPVNTSAEKPTTLEEGPPTHPAPAGTTRDDDGQAFRAARIKSHRTQNSQQALPSAKAVTNEAPTTIQQVNDDDTPETTTKATTRRKAAKRTKRTDPTSPAKVAPRRPTKPALRGNSPLHELNHNTIMNRSGTGKPARKTSDVLPDNTPDEPTKAAPKTKQPTKSKRKDHVNPTSELASLNTNPRKTDGNADWLFDPIDNPSKKVVATSSKTKSTTTTSRSTATKRKREAGHSDDIDLDDLLLHVATFAK